MSGHRKWSEVRKSRPRSGEVAVSEDARADLKKKLREHANTLADLRRARLMTQHQLARFMQVSQAQVSRVENQADLYLSTLRSYVEAMGGELQIRVAFPGSGWTEVTVGDVTAHGDRLAEDVTENSVANSAAPALELLVQPSTYVGELPPAQQISAMCVSTNLWDNTWPAYATALRTLMARHPGLLTYSAASGVILREAQEGENIGAQRFAWRTAKDPYIPEDSERFISTAIVKEP